MAKDPSPPPLPNVYVHISTQNNNKNVRIALKISPNYFVRPKVWILVAKNDKDPIFAPAFCSC